MRAACASIEVGVRRLQYLRCLDHHDSDEQTLTEQRAGFLCLDVYTFIFSVCGYGWVGKGACDLCRCSIRTDGCSFGFGSLSYGAVEFSSSDFNGIFPARKVL